MPRGRKTNKRPRVEEPEQDSIQPIAKRMNQLDLTGPQSDHGNDPSTVQRTSKSDMEGFRATTFKNVFLTMAHEPPYWAACQVEEWQRAGGFEPDLAMYVPGVCGTDEIPASDNPYCKVNKVLFELHSQWLQRQRADFSP